VILSQLNQFEVATWEYEDLGANWELEKISGVDMKRTVDRNVRSTKFSDFEYFIWISW